MTFAQDMAKFVRTAENRLKKTVAQSVWRLSREVVMSTPIDQPFGWHDEKSVGVARGGWFISFDISSANQVERKDPSGQATIKRIASSLQTYQPRRHNAIYLNNNVPYINMLEKGGYQNFVNRLKSTPTGFSTQAPAGMARLGAMLWPTFVNAAVSSVRMVS